MMDSVYFAMPGNEDLALALTAVNKADTGKLEIRYFPDGETYVRVLSDVKARNAFVVCSLRNPNEQFLSLFFLGSTLKSLGAAKITLIAPYLAYMRQDKIFNKGEA